MRILLILLTLLILSCGPAYHLKKAQRQLRKAIELGAKVDQDTVFQDREIIVPGEILRVEVPRESILLKDTIIYVDRWHPGKGAIRIIHDSVSVLIQADCPPDTVRVEVPVVVTKSISAGVSDWWKPVAIGLAVVALILAAIVILKKKE